MLLWLSVFWALFLLVFSKHYLYMPLANKWSVLLFESLHWSVVGGQDIHTLSEAHRGAPKPPRLPSHSDVHAERGGGMVRFSQPIASEHMAWPRPASGSHMAGWSESSKAWLNMKSLLERCHLCGSTAGYCSTERKAWKYSRLSKPIAQARAVQAAELPLWFISPWGFYT